MFCGEMILALCLLTAPVDAEHGQDNPELFPVVASALQHLAIHLEILDQREIRYVLARVEDFAADMKLLRRRYHDLADAPALLECQRFPERNVVNDLLSFNRTYRQYLTLRQPMEVIHGDQVRAAVRETDQLYQVWDAVRDARCEYYYVTVRRQALKQLRELIGQPAFYRSQLPPHVPVWRFPEID